VYLDSGKRWLEKTSDGRSNEFVEQEVTDDAVRLADASRKLVIWLKADQMTFSRNGSKAVFCTKGEWTPISDVPALLASLSRPALPPPRVALAKPIAVYRFDGKSLARFHAPREFFAPGKPFTIEFWYRRTDASQAAAGLLRMGSLNLVVKRRGEDAPPRHFCQLYCSSSGAAWNVSSDFPVDQAWHHLAVTVAGDRIDVHHDGQPLSGTSLMSLAVDSLEPVALGSAQSSAGPESLQGEIKSVRVADKAKYRGGQTFTPPAAEPDELLPGTSLVLAKITDPAAETVPGPPSLTDLLRPRGESLPRVGRVAPPEGDALKEAQAAVANVYGERVKGAQKREEKQKLSADLLKTATTDREAARSYALLMEGRRLAVVAMDVVLGIEIINEMDRRFTVERVVLLEKLLAELEKKSITPQQREVLLDEALAGAQAAIKQDQPAAAESLASLAARTAGKGKDAEKKKFAQALRDRAGARNSAFEALQSGLETLKDSPDDPAANLAVGRYLAFARGDFAQGCMHLVKGGDATLADAAQKQLAAQSDEDRLAVLAAWSALLPSLKSPAEKLQLQRHILEVCEELRPRLTGLAQAQAEKYIDQLRPIVAESDKYATVTRPAPGLIVRILAMRGNAKLPIPLPFVAVATSNQDLARLNAVEVLRPFRGRMRYRLAGAVVVPSDDMAVQLRFENCNVRLLNEARVATSARPINQRIKMKKGVHPIAIESGGPGFSFSVTDADTLESLLQYHPSDLERELSQTGVDASGAQAKTQLVN
jgi:hypothetical protein